MSLQRQVRRAAERRLERVSKTPEVAYLLNLVYGLYKADKEGETDKFEEIFSEVRGYCRKIESALDSTP